MDYLAEPVITVRAQLRSSRGAHSRDPVARNDEDGAAPYITTGASGSSFDPPPHRGKCAASSRETAATP
jgi:hypothetical protein